MTSFGKWQKLGTMHGLQRLQNIQFGSKIEIKKKKHVRNASRTTLELFFAKKTA